MLSHSELIKKEVKTLWKKCFHDNDDFVEFYFSRRYSDDINLVRYDDNGHVMSALQMIPYPMTFCGGEIKTSYISGACTDPAFQNRGEMRRLLTDAHRNMYARGMALSTLIPAEEWLHGYYARSGYVDCFTYTEHMMQMDFSSRPLHYDRYIISSCSSSVCDDVYEYFNEHMHRRNCCLQHMRDDFSVVVDDLYLSGGALWVARCEGKVVGLLFAYPDGVVLSAVELLADNDLVMYVLLYNACMSSGRSQVRRLHPSLSSIYDENEITKKHVLGMARVVNPQAMLVLWAARHPEKELYLLLTDDNAIPANNGYYTLNKGICSLMRQAGKKYTPITVAQLTQLLLKEEQPYMSLMLN